MTFQKVDFLIGFHSQYDVLHHFTRKLYEAGLRAGLDCRILDRQEMQNLPKHSPPDLSIGFNGIPRNAQDVLLCDVFKIPYLSILVDPPYRFWYVTKSPYSLVSCDDQYGCKLLDQVNFRRSFFLPHGVEPELEPDPNVKKVFDTVMLTTFIDFEAIKENWKNLFPPVICKVMEEAAEIAFFEPRISFIASFNTLLDEAQSKNPPQLFENVLMTRVLEELEIYIKGKDKYLLATSIKEATLHIFGDTISKKSWKDYLGKNHPNIFPHGPVSFSQALEIIKQSKVLLNANIKNKEGAHERIFAGFAGGAAVITNESSYISQTFQEGRDILFYRHTDLKQVNAAVNDLLANESKRQNLANHGRQIVMEHHTWDHRLQELLKQSSQLVKTMKF